MMRRRLSSGSKGSLLRWLVGYSFLAYVLIIAALGALAR
jgi:hypothetical protein